MNSLSGSQLRVVTDWNNLYKYDSHTERINSTTYRIIGGYASDVVVQLSQFLNFSITLVPVINGWDFDKAEEFNIDLFMGSFVLYERRAKIVDPTFVTGYSKAIALINHDFEGSQGHSFLQPFTPSLWIFYLLFVVLCIIVMSIMGAAEGLVCWRDMYYDVIAACLQKRTHLEYASFKSSLTKWLIYMMALIVLTCYSGKLVSLLTVRIYLIRDLNTLLDSNFKIMLERGYNNGSPLQGILESLQSVPPMQKLLDKAQHSQFVYESFEKTVEAVKLTPSAYVIDEDTAVDAVLNSLGHFPCSWTTIPLAGIRYPWSFFMRKKSQFKQSINTGILKFDQSGLLFRTRMKWIPSSKAKCEEGPSSSLAKSLQSGVPFRFIAHAVGVFCSGIFTGLISVLTEKYILKNKRFSFNWKTL